MSAPPTKNPFRYCAINSKHWRNAQEIKPGLWLVEECSGPKATTVNMIAVKSRIDRITPWQYVAQVNRPRRGVCTLTLNLWPRSWKITAPKDEQGDLVRQMLELIKVHA